MILTTIGWCAGVCDKWQTEASHPLGIQQGSFAQRPCFCLFPNFYRYSTCPRQGQIASLVDNHTLINVHPGLHHLGPLRMHIITITTLVLFL